MLKHLFVLAAAVGLLAACPPPEQQMTTSEEDEDGRDTTMIRTSLNALGDSYEAAMVEGNAAAIANLFTEDATAVFYGYPTVSGRAAIEGLYAAMFPATRFTAVEIVTGPLSAPADDLATALGTTAVTADSSGVRSRAWWRWAASYRRGTDGQWRLSYLMAFPDSVQAAP